LASFHHFLALSHDVIMKLKHASFQVSTQKRWRAIIIIFSSLLLGKQRYCESRVKKFIVTYLSCLLQEKQGYPKSVKILNYEMSLVYGKSPR
jgi:hypothetical protein